ncbi:rhodanese-like domain-containing protein [Halostella pelagica]|uniref:rhodanese-like domain-containing protein n=1 Tax=Halostella pelagica TaxID=2583824 RepID=UPI001081ECCE|nr:rhodanese-like domain-containing protein [Halostella pelagica]
MNELDRTADEFLAEARERIDEVSAAEAMDRHGPDGPVFLDVRDETEVREDDVIPGAVHASRSMIEFEADPTSDYHSPAFCPDKRYICYCVVGLRSTFVTDRLREMGYDIANLAGGIEAWRDAGGPVVPYENCDREAAVTEQ